MKQFLYSVATDQISGGCLCLDLLKAVLRVLSWLYRLAVEIIHILYGAGIWRQQSLPRVVISVGNVTVGGAGKTPLVEYIVRMLKDKKLRPVVLTRGYMGKGMRFRGLKSDEAEMLSRSLGDVPVLTGADRLKNARDFIRDHPADVFVLDDGFQQWRLARNLDIVVVDAVNPWGNGCLLPRGILREPLSSLRRAGVIVLTKTDLGSGRVPEIRTRLRSLGCRALIVESLHQPVDFVDLRSGQIRPLSFMEGKDACLVCSIGDPQSLRTTLVNAGVRIKKDFIFMDHHLYDAVQVQTIAQECRRERIPTIITTQKDAVKLDSFLDLLEKDRAVLSLRITIKITQGEHEFVERIMHLS